MKAKQWFSALLALLMVLSLGVAFAATASPTAATVTVAGDVVEKVTTPSAASVAAMTTAAQSYIADNFPSDYQAITLLTVDITFKPNTKFPLDINFNVSGAKVGDTILIAHQKADGTIEILEGIVTADGVVKVTVGSASPFSIIKVTNQAQDDDQTLPKTGDANANVPALLLLAASLALLAGAGVSLRRAK